MHNNARMNTKSCRMIDCFIRKKYWFFNSFSYILSRHLKVAIPQFSLSLIKLYNNAA